jgi:hypothetical protein
VTVTACLRWSPVTGGELFYHGKGAAPAWTDAAGPPRLGVIPLNMAAPILLTLRKDNTTYASFAPHGARRNIGRTRLPREAGLLGLTKPAYLARSREPAVAPGRSIGRLDLYPKRSAW